MVLAPPPRRVVSLHPRVGRWQFLQLPPTRWQRLGLLCAVRRHGWLVPATAAAVLTLPVSESASTKRFWRVWVSFHLSHRMGLRRTSTDRLESGARRSMSALPSVLLEGEAISWIVSSMDGLGFLPPMPTDPAVSERLQAGSVSVKTRRRISVVIT